MASEGLCVRDIALAVSESPKEAWDAPWLQVGQGAGVPGLPRLFPLVAPKLCGSGAAAALSNYSWPLAWPVNLNNTINLPVSAP